ncbi:hypothetical protein V2J09_003941 [Rumex salicifolius]
MGSDEKKRVCVTGGTGFIGSWLIKTLLQNGYSVNAPIRYPRPEKKKDISYLTSLPGASEHLTIFDADLNDPDSFAAAIQGCMGVFHLAHFTDLQGAETDEAVSKRNVDALLGILNASLSSKTVKRVVYTSSAAAVINNREAAPPVGNGETVNPTVLDEGSWSDVEYMKEAMPKMLRSYATAKTLTEKAALEFGEREGGRLEVVTVAPSYATGAFLTPWIPGSVTAPLSPLFGNENAYPRLFNIKMVHVDDLVRALIFLLESPTTKGGRYIATSYHGQFLELCDYLAGRYPDLYKKQKKSPNELKDIKGAVPPSMSAQKLLDAGFQFIHGRDDMFDDAIRSCKEKGIL